MRMFELLPRPLGSIFRKLTHLTCNSRCGKNFLRARKISTGILQSLDKVSTGLLTGLRLPCIGYRLPARTKRCSEVVHCETVSSKRGRRRTVAPHL